MPQKNSCRQNSDNFRGWLLLAVFILLTVVFDAVTTVDAVNLGATELNPLMAELLKLGPVWFSFIKVTWAALCLSGLLYGVIKRSRSARIGLIAVAAICTLNFIYQAFVWLFIF